MTTEKISLADRAKWLPMSQERRNTLCNVGEAMATKEQAQKVEPEPPMPQKTQARGRLTQHKSGVMNKTEAAYAETVLEPRKRAGEIADYWFERFTFKLADDCRYTPDFVVMLPDGELECHEVKGGFFRDDAKVKLKVAASMFPFTFRLCIKLPKKEGGDWKITEV